MPKATPSPTTDNTTKPAAVPVDLVTIEFRGTTFTIPREMDEWETEACLAMGQKQYLQAAKLLLGPTQWAVLQSLGSKRKDSNEFLASLIRVINADCIS